MREASGILHLTERAHRRVVGHNIPLLNWTDQGLRNVKESPKRADIFEKSVKKLVGVASSCRTLGQHDLVADVKLPDGEAMLKLGLELGRLGNVRTTTLEGWTKQEMARAISSLKAYRPQRPFHAPNLDAGTSKLYAV